MTWLQAWADGKFVNDPPPTPAGSLDQVDLALQPATLDEAALAFCLADAFHPGCELTWPVRIRHLYSGLFRIKRRPAGFVEPDYGDVLTPAVAVSPTGPLNGSAAGDLTRWMAVPWQTDTASCLAGYDFFNTSLHLLPTFWPARVPNTVLREEDYLKVMDRSRPQQERIELFHARFDWFRIFAGQGAPPQTTQMITKFAELGIIEERKGPDDLPGVPLRVWVESKPGLTDPDAGPPGPSQTPAGKSIFAGRSLRQFGQYGKRPHE